MIQRKENWTPAPWFRNEDGFIVAGTGTAQVEIAELDCSLLIDIDEREANKEITMAAIPMFEALKFAERELDWMGDDNPLMVAIRSALALATGTVAE